MCVVGNCYHVVRTVDSVTEIGAAFATRKIGRHLPTPSTNFCAVCSEAMFQYLFRLTACAHNGVNQPINARNASQVERGIFSLLSWRAKPAGPPSLYEHILPWICTFVLLGIWKLTPVPCKIRQGPLMRKHVHEAVSLNKRTLPAI